MVVQSSYALVSGLVALMFSRPQPMTRLAHLWRPCFVKSKPVHADKSVRKDDISFCRDPRGFEPHPRTASPGMCRAELQPGNQSDYNPTCLHSSQMGCDELQT